MASKPWQPPTPAHELMITKLTRSYKRLQAAGARLDVLEAERDRLYEQARAMDPPVTYAAIAAVFDVTEAAIMQKVKRVERERANGVTV